MGYSGLIYAAIVACWAAVLVPRWIRRNEEVERAREEDAARGIRVLERRQSHVRHGSGVPAQPAPGLPSATRRLGQDETLDASPHADDARPTDHEPGEDDAEDLHDFELPSFGAAARRRRRVIMLLLLALAVVSLAIWAGRLGPVSIAVPAVLLAGFLVLARRAAVTEKRRHARMRRVLAGRRAEAQAKSQAQSANVAAVSSSGKRIAVLDTAEPAEPAEAADPNAWEPVPVPLPTYLTKAKAEPPVVRKIDLSSPGAWTSGRLNPSGSIALPPPRQADDEDLPEQRRAVGG